MRKEDYPFKPGDLVKCNYAFARERAYWKLPYPRIGDYLIVTECLQHEEFVEDFMLFFEEPRLSIPLHASRFDLVQREEEGDVLLNEAYKIVNNL